MQHSFNYMEKYNNMHDVLSLYSIKQGMQDIPIPEFMLFLTHNM